MTLSLVPIRWVDAETFVRAWHRHNRPPPRWLFGVGVATDDGTLVGVAIVGRPVARMFDDGLTVEVTRVATDGYPNACSMLYGATARAAFALGYRRVVTYTRADEPGTALTAANWRVVAERRRRAGRRGWDQMSRPRSTAYDPIPRTLWEAVDGPRQPV